MYMFEEVVCNIILVFTNLILIYMFDSLRIQTYTYALIKYYSISVKKITFSQNIHCTRIQIQIESPRLHHTFLKISNPVCLNTTTTDSYTIFRWLNARIRLLFHVGTFNRLRNSRNRKHFKFCMFFPFTFCHILVAERHLVKLPIPREQSLWLL